MNRDRFLAIHSILAAGFGIALVLAPRQTAAIYGSVPDAFGIYMSRLLGAAFLAFAGITWLARGAESGKGIRAITGGMALGAAVGFIASLYGQLTGASNINGWSTVAIYAFLAVGYLIFFTRAAER